MEAPGASGIALLPIVSIQAELTFCGSVREWLLCWMCAQAEGTMEAARRVGASRGTFSGQTTNRIE